jgi:uncharacterized repeat protein (TIGR03803 family)
MTKMPTFELPSVSARAKIPTLAASHALRSACVIFFLFSAGSTFAPAQSFTSLLSFDGADGAFPQGSLTRGPDGKLYGTTPYAGLYGGGTVFEITPNGELTTLYNFCSERNCADGAEPYGGLVRTGTGNFYGVTSGQGFGTFGTVFEITPQGELTTLYRFCSQPNCTDGATPYAELAQGSDGNFYGTTNAGGAYNAGTIFEITPKGKLTTLHSFCSEMNCADGEAPLLNGLVQGRDGNFYGTTPTGGASAAGTVFEITPKGQLATLYNFCSQPNCTDGATPCAGLVRGSDGNFYGTTYSGGTYNRGTIFEITATGKLIGLHSFGDADGGAPYAGLVQAINGDLYGTTFAGGASGYGGTVFEITPKGQLTTLYSFCAQSNCIDGLGPVAGLTEDATGNFYGTTYAGGVNGTSECGLYGEYGCGTLFRLAVEPTLGKTLLGIGADHP